MGEIPRMTAEEFISWAHGVIASEAYMTEENNEDCSLGDYIADLRDRLKREARGI